MPLLGLTAPRKRAAVLSRKPSRSPLIMLFSCHLDIRASPLPFPCWSWGECALGKVSAGSCVPISVCVSRLKEAPVITFPTLGLGHAGILQGKMKRMFEDLCSICEQGLEERRSKKKIGAEFKSMSGRD